MDVCPHDMDVCPHDVDVSSHDMGLCSHDTSVCPHDMCVVGTSRMVLSDAACSVGGRGFSEVSGSMCFGDWV